MCGIAGFLTLDGFAPAEASVALSKMSNALRHRGPDDSGYWLDPDAGVGLGHRRLSVIDLTETGHQPMASDDGRYRLVFNGEIYNHLELREVLGARSWRGHSDTETLLAAIQHWGLPGALQRSIGMFAIALWDREQRCLHLARDRIGEKPLFYGWQGRSLLFASELKALCEHPSFNAKVDRLSLAQYARNGYVSTPRSIFSGIQKLAPGAIITFKNDGVPDELPMPRPYWRLDEVIAERTRRPFEGTPDEAVRELESLLTSAIRLQRISDVPLGAFLSGGIDSSTVVAVMQSVSAQPVKTYTIGFEDDGYNEAHHARAVAKHLQTDHTEYHVSGSDALKIIPRLPDIYDEPFADFSQIPTILVSQMARREVTVALSGDGGDELFCGYGRYPQAAGTWARLSRIPYPLRAMMERMLPLGRLRDGIAARNLDAFYQFLNAQWKGFPRIVVGVESRIPRLDIPSALDDDLERMMYCDTIQYLPDDILVKVDRASMSVSLETRMPFLDHHIVEFAWSLPIGLKRRDGVAKWPLKQLLYKHVPEPLVNRPKMGFGVPLHVWLRGPLRDWAENLLSTQRLKSDGYFDPAAVRAEWELHLSGKKDRHFGLWTILMFQAWKEQLSK